MARALLAMTEIRAASLTYPRITEPLQVRAVMSTWLGEIANLLQVPIVMSYMATTGKQVASISWKRISNMDITPQGIASTAM